MLASVGCDVGGRGGGVGRREGAGAAAEAGCRRRSRRRSCHPRRLGRVTGRVVVGHGVRDRDRLHGVDRRGGVAEVEHDLRRQVADRAQQALEERRLGRERDLVQDRAQRQLGEHRLQRLEVDRDDQPLDRARGLVAVGLVRRLGQLHRDAERRQGRRRVVRQPRDRARRAGGDVALGTEAEGLAGDGHGAVVGPALRLAGRAVAAGDDRRGDAGHRHRPPSSRTSPSAAREVEVTSGAVRDRLAVGDVPVHVDQRRQRRRELAGVGVGRVVRRPAVLGPSAREDELREVDERPAQAEHAQDVVEVVEQRAAPGSPGTAAAAAGPAVARVVAGAVTGVAVVGEARRSRGPCPRPTSWSSRCRGTACSAALVVSEGYCEFTWTGVAVRDQLRSAGRAGRRRS